jgi:ATP-dependent helicase/nuclease subunit A
VTASFKPADAAIRKQATEDIQDLFAVEAGAGTGKTSLLVARYLQLIQKGGASPSQIVAITFTEKAAAELKDRIREKLGESEHPALEELDRAPISTIHAFASSLLRERPMEAGIDPNFQQLDQIAAQAFLDHCYDWFFPTILSSKNRSITRALAAGISLGRIRQLALLLLYRHRDLLAGIPKTGNPLDTESFFLEVATEADSLWALASSQCVDTMDAGYQSIEKLYQEVASLRSASADVKERALLVRIQAAGKGNQKAWANPKVAKEQKERMRALGAKLKEAQSSLRQDIFTELLSALADYASYVDEEKRKNGKLDFDDLLLLSRNLLKEHRDVLDYFRGRYKYLLVDEFQDTDPVQTELVFQLASRPASPNTVGSFDLEPGKLFLVGDPKQSIYRFRRASIEVYGAATKNLEKIGSRLLIQQNFRSSPALIDWVNAVFPTVLADKQGKALKHLNYFLEGHCVQIGIDVDAR